MEIKYYKRVSVIISFFLWLIIFNDIIEYLFDVFGGETDPAYFHIIPQTIYVIDLMILVVFYIVIIKNIENRGVFVKRNEVIFLWFGLVIAFLALSSDVLFNWLTGNRPSGPRILAALGGTLVFVSFIFKIGNKIQEEQDLTV